MYRVGIDVGGTNTDACILDEELKVIHSVKVATTKDVETGVYNALKKVIDESKIDHSLIKYAMLGTTHCTNAIVERKRLNNVAMIRIGKPATTAILPFIDWPEDLREKIELDSILVSGGYEFDGRKINELCKEEVVEFCNKIKDRVESVAISGVFAPVNKQQEEEVAKWVREILGDIPISLSNEIGNIGILERENGAILNSALSQVGKAVSLGFEKALKDLGIDAQIYFSQNDGTLMNLEYTMKYPIFTIGCGITNSIRGASFLSEVKNAIVLDVGGTTSDLGVLYNGFPRESSIPVTIGGVHTNFRMPDVLTIGLAGGTCVKGEKDNIKIGPESVGYKITEDAIIFGGDTLTLSDVVTRLDMAFEDRKTNVEHLDKEYCDEVYKKVILKLEDAVDQMKTSQDDVELVLTGGGSIIVPEKLRGISNVIRPPHYTAANAIGAALGQISGDVEKVYSLDKMSREDAIEDAKQEAVNKALKAGAKKDTIEVLNIEDVPLAYLPGNALLIKVKVVGDLI
ncbi:hydantoinase/oxoprolinase family protein [Clostridioides sp. ZZV14-6387]|uniref:ROK family protein n=1 Tax=Clostridioides sp. ZZV14-6387 TaxID=2811497 RepID=UPI001D10087C|nr:hydantoinase/oxoprolinase family protein [Clostridioides sp. ZZV14-6387]